MIDNLEIKTNLEEEAVDFAIQSSRVVSGLAWAVFWKEKNAIQNMKRHVETKTICVGELRKSQQIVKWWPAFLNVVTSTYLRKYFIPLRTEIRWIHRWKSLFEIEKKTLYSNDMFVLSFSIRTFYYDKMNLRGLTI